MHKALVALFAMGLFACEAVEVDTQSAPIVNGTINEGDPAVVSVGRFCTGTLVSPKTVLTARHCLSTSSTPNYSVYFGTDTDDGQGEWIEAVHQQRYEPGGVGNGDLAMITLAEPGPAIPIPVGDRDLAPYTGDVVRVAGFGTVGENSGGNGIKRVGDSSLDSVETGVMFCNNQPSGTCYGDSGGPNFMTFDGVEYVVGTTSYGTSACGSGLDASARTDTHIDWIRNYIAEHDPADCGEDLQCASGCDSIDPDCPCAADGFCTDACGDVAADPDCEGCGDDGTCREDCPVLDNDCCVADDDCNAECGDTDPDCPGGDPGAGGDDGSGGDGSDGTSEIVGGCATGGSGPWWIVLAVALGLVARRRGIAPSTTDE